MARNLESVRAHVEVLAWARARKTEIAALETSARDAIEEALGAEEIGELDGATVVTWTTHKKRQLQQKAMREAFPELVEEFTELVEARTFKMVDPS